MGAASHFNTLPRNPRVWWSRVKYRWPFLIWLAAVVACVSLYMRSGHLVAINGVVEVTTEQLAPVETARLLAVRVVPGQQVKAGDILAEFDTSVIDAEIREIEAKAAIENLQIERVFSRAVSDAELRLRELRQQQAADQNRLDALREQFKGIDMAISSTMADARGVAAYRAEQVTLERNLQLQPEAIRSAEGDYKLAQQQLEAARKAGAPEAVRDLIAALTQRKENYVVRARHSGAVSRVLHAPGDVVAAADPVLSIVAQGAPLVIGFVPEWMAHDIHVGMQAWVTRPLRSGDAIAGAVTVLGPEILALPGRVSPVRGQTVRGRRVEILLQGGADLLPGESVDIRVYRPWWMDRFQRLRDRVAPAAQ